MFFNQVSSLGVKSSKKSLRSEFQILKEQRTQSADHITYSKPSKHCYEGYSVDSRECALLIGNMRSLSIYLAASSKQTQAIWPILHDRFEFINSLGYLRLPEKDVSKRFLPNLVSDSLYQPSAIHIGRTHTESQLASAKAGTALDFLQIYNLIRNSPNAAIPSLAS